MNTIARNHQMWTDDKWDRNGEQWSDGWGGPRAQWLFSIYPRIAASIPAGKIVEIATGHGRWSRFLIEECVDFTGFDLVEKCSSYCQERYGAPNRRFIKNDGLRLIGISDKSVDFIFSMDSLVHVDWATLKSYLTEILRTLKPGARAFIHHSNALAVEGFENLEPQTRKAFRAADVSAEAVRREVTALGGGVFSQEIIDWGGSGEKALIDCFSIISSEPCETRIVQNPHFMLDMSRIAKVSSLYT